MNRFLTCITILFLIGCNSVKYTDILDQSNAMIDSDPDSAIILLDMIDFPEDLPSREKADYWYLKSLAHYNAGKAMSEDSLILFTLDYYKDQDNTNRLSRTYMLATSYYYWQGNKSAATRTAQEGLQYNINANDSSGIARFYDILAEISLDYGKNYKNAISYMHAASRYDTKGSYNRDYETGICYAWTGPADSSAFFMEKSINSALVHGDTMAAIHFIRNQADILYSRKKYAESLSLMKKLKTINPVLQTSSCLTFANLYLALHQPDSALFYTNKARDAKSSDDYSLSTDNHIMTLQVAISYALNQHINWAPSGKYNDSIWIDQLGKLKITEEKIYARSQSEQKNLKLVISRQRIRSALISVSLLTVLLIFIFIFYNRKKKEKIETLQSMLKEAMHSSSTHKDDYFFKKILLQQLGLIRLVATSPSSHNQELLKQISQIANKETPVDEILNWDDLYKTIDSIYDHFYTKLIHNYNNKLNEKEIQLCCLLCAEFSTKEISVVIQQSVRTIYQRKTTIRQKLEMNEKDDIIAFLNNIHEPQNMPV